MIIIKPSIYKVISNIFLGLLGIIALFLIVEAFTNTLISSLISTLFIIAYLYFYAYRDIYIFVIENNILTINRYNKILYQINIKDAVFSFEYSKDKQRIKMRTLNIIYNNENINLDLELLSSEDYELLKKELTI